MNPAGSVVKTGQIWAGAPAKLLRTVSAEEAGFLVQSADNYARLAREHKCALLGGWGAGGAAAGAHTPCGRAARTLAPKRPPAGGAGVQIRRCPRRGQPRVRESPPSIRLCAARARQPSLRPPTPPRPPLPRIENGKAFEEVLLDSVIAGERSWREKSDIDVHQGIYRDAETQTILSMR
jgi:hypothetical protein